MSMLTARSFANPVYVAQKVWLYSRSRVALRPSDIILALYPKTGSTWIRFVLYHMLARAEETGTFDEVNRVMPEFAHRSMFAPWPFPHAPRIIKTHQPRSFFFGAQPAVLIVRDPRDIMVSFWFYARAKKTVGFDGTLLDLMRHPRLGLEAFFRHYNSWAAHAGLVSRYEVLRTDPLAGFRAIFEHCGLAVTDAELQRALDLSSVQRMREAQQASQEAFANHEKGFVFARKATSAQWLEHFGEPEHEYYATVASRHDFRLYG